MSALIDSNDSGLESRLITCHGSYFGRTKALSPTLVRPRCCVPVAPSGASQPSGCDHRCVAQQAAQSKPFMRASVDAEAKRRRPLVAGVLPVETDLSASVAAHPQYMRGPRSIRRARAVAIPGASPHFGKNSRGTIFDDAIAEKTSPVGTPTVMPPKSRTNEGAWTVTPFVFVITISDRPTRIQRVVQGDQAQPGRAAVGRPVAPLRRMFDTMPLKDAMAVPLPLA
jgi:hypothetical protein